MVLRTVGNLSKSTQTLAFHLAFKIPYVYDYITKMCRKEAEVVQNRDNVNVRNIGRSEAPHRKFERLKLGGQVYDRSSV